MFVDCFIRMSSSEHPAYSEYFADFKVRSLITAAPHSIHVSLNLHLKICSYIVRGYAECY